VSVHRIGPRERQTDIQHPRSPRPEEAGLQAKQREFWSAATEPSRRIIQFGPGAWS
jgi:hypothetical protein